MSENPTRTSFGMAALALLGAAIFLPGLGDSGLWDPWEPKYAQTARETARAESWVVPQYRELPRLVKPPLTYALIAVSQAAFGVTETAARLPSVVLAILAALALAGTFAAHDRHWEGWIAGGALLTSPQWYALGRSATPDIPFAALLMVALSLALIRPKLEGRGPRRAALLGCIVAIGLATLTEWPRGLILPVWALAAWAALRRPVWGGASFAAAALLYTVGQHLYSGPIVLAAFALMTLAACAGMFVELRPVPRDWLSVGLAGLVLVVVVAPWFVAVMNLEPAETTERLFGYKHGLNLGETTGQHRGPLWYVVEMIAVGGFPWFAFAVVGLAWARRTKQDPLAQGFAAALVAGVLFFTLSEAKMAHFYAVLQPAAAGLAAVGLARTVGAGRGTRRWSGLVAAAAVLLISALLVFIEPQRVVETFNVFRRLHGADPRLVWGIVLVAWSAAVALAVWRRQSRWLLLGVLPAAVGVANLGWFLVPQLSPQKSVQQLWLRYTAERTEGESLGAYGPTKHSTYYYSDNQAVRLRSIGALSEFLDSDERRFLTAPRGEVSRIRRLTGPRGRWTALEDSHDSHVLLLFDPARPVRRAR